MKYRNAADLREDCQNFFKAFVAEGQKLYPHATPSHLCIKTVITYHFPELTKFARDLGQVYTRQHENRDITWVKLKEPLTCRHVPDEFKPDAYQDFTLNWLEITQPDNAPVSATRPHALVFAQNNFGERQKIHSQKNRQFVLRCQEKAAEAIVQPQ